MWKNSRGREELSLSISARDLHLCRFTALRVKDLLGLVLMVSCEAVKTDVLQQEIVHLSVFRLQKLPEYLIQGISIMH